MFRKIIKKLRKRKRRYEYGCLPFSFNVMLEYLSDKSKRQEINQEISDCDFTIESVSQTLTKFLSIFEQNKDYIERGLREQL